MTEALDYSARIRKMIEVFVGERESIHIEAVRILESGVGVVKGSLQDLVVRADEFLSLYGDKDDIGEWVGAHLTIEEIIADDGTFLDDYITLTEMSENMLSRTTQALVQVLYDGDKEKLRRPVAIILKVYESRFRAD